MLIFGFFRSPTVGVEEVVEVEEEEVVVEEEAAVEEEGAAEVKEAFFQYFETIFSPFLCAGLIYTTLVRNQIQKLYF